jgi:hypothetical protein
LHPESIQFRWFLETDTGSFIVGATIPFTVTDSAGHPIPITIPSQVTKNFARYDFLFVSTQLIGNIITAHYAGSADTLINIGPK